MEEVVFNKNKVYQFNTYDELVVFFKSHEGDARLDNFYCEKHHIVPRCEGGNNDKDNIVLLPYRYHIQAHWLRALEYKTIDNFIGYRDNIHAVRVSLMGQYKKDKVGSCRSEDLQIALYDEQYCSMLESHRQQYKELLSYLYSGENNPNYGRTHSEEARQKISIANRGRKKSPDEIAAIVDKLQKTVHQYMPDGDYIQSFNSRTEACVYTNIPAQNISTVLTGVRKAAGGFLWTDELIDPSTEVYFCRFHYEDTVYKELVRLAKLLRHNQLRKTVIMASKKHNGVEIHQFTKDGVYIQSFKTVSSAAEHIGVGSGRVCAVARGERNHTKGYKFCYTLPEGITPIYVEPVVEDLEDLPRSYFGDRVTHKYTLSNVYICSYKSVASASRGVGGSACGIYQALNGKYKHSHGFIWKDEVPYGTGIIYEEA